MNWKQYLRENLEEHRKSLLKLGYKNESKQMKARRIFFVPLKAVLYESDVVIKIKRDDLLTQDNFEKVFAELCDEGRSWIRLGLFGIVEDLLIIDFAAGNAVGNPKPNIVFSGAPGLKVQLID